MRRLNIFMIVVSSIASIIALIDKNYTTFCWTMNTTLWCTQALIYSNETKTYKDMLENCERHNIEVITELETDLNGSKK